MACGEECLRQTASWEGEDSGGIAFGSSKSLESTFEP